VCSVSVCVLSVVFVPIVVRVIVLILVGRWNVLCYTEGLSRFETIQPTLVIACCQLKGIETKGKCCNWFCKKGAFLCRCIFLVVELKKQNKNRTFVICNSYFLYQTTEERFDWIGSEAVC
jgi:hypothetical protein